MQREFIDLSLKVAPSHLINRFVGRGFQPRHQNRKKNRALAPGQPNEWEELVIYEMAWLC
jgi:hypothetical protein